MTRILPRWRYINDFHKLWFYPNSKVSETITNPNLTLTNSKLTINPNLKPKRIVNIRPLECRYYGNHRVHVTIADDAALLASFARVCFVNFISSLAVACSRFCIKSESKRSPGANFAAEDMKSNIRMIFIFFFSSFSRCEFLNFESNQK